MGPIISPEKQIPHTHNPERLIQGKELPALRGDGGQLRDWLFVSEDHARGTPTVWPGPGRSR